jgi:hypothetical protein
MGEITIRQAQAKKKKASGSIFGLKSASELWILGASAGAPGSSTQACRKDTIL